jgi:branched-chain amino acid transport system substrate-binding protein
MAEAGHLGQATRQSGRRNLLRMAVLGTALFAAGCAVVPKGPPKTIDRPPEDVGPPTTGLPSDAGRHRVALLVPLTGGNAAVGESISNAANMAVLDTGGQKIRITVYDTALGATAAAERAVADGNKLILGPLLAEDVRAAAEVGRRARVPLIAFSNDVSVAGNGAYLLGFTPAQSVARVVEHARSNGMTKFSAIAPAGVYGQRALTSLRNTVESSGGRIVSIQTFDRSSGGIMAAISRMNKAGSADAILIADSGRVAIQAVPIIRRTGNSTAKILGTELWNTDAGLGQSPMMNGAWYASVSDGLYRQLAAKYRVRFSKGPYRLASLGYDAVLLTTKVAGNWKVGTAFPARALDDQGGFAGIDGAFRFNSYGVAERALEVQQIAPKGTIVVAAAPKSFAN